MTRITQMEKLWVILLLACALGACTNSDEEKLILEQVSPDIPKRPKYSKTITDINARRQALSGEYSKANNSKEKQKVLAEARAVFVSSIADTVFPYWYGTPWDYNGTTRAPGKGKIACGYFVTTVLLDAGLQIERAKMAQQASEVMIKSLTSEEHIRRFSNTTIDKFVKAVSRWGPGLYVVGLDNHTGFILNDNTDVYFVHSTLAKPSCVFKERALTSPVLSASRYRVLGKISADDALLAKWLNNTRFTTKSRRQ